MKDLIAIFILFFSFNINAALINNNTYTTDDVTNLDWLDLTATLGMTSNAVRFEISSKWDNDLHAWVPSTFMGGGWRFANEVETIDLVIRNIGAFGSYPFGGVESTNAINLINLFGVTNNITFGDPYTAGLFIADNNNLNLIVIESTETNRYFHSVSGSSTGGSAVGKFLVRDHLQAVPIPSSLLLFISGLALFYNYNRNHQSKYC